MSRVKAGENKSEVIHLRVPVLEFMIVQKLAISTGIGISTQVKVLLREALRARKLIK